MAFPLPQVVSENGAIEVDLSAAGSMLPGNDAIRRALGYAAGTMDAHFDEVLDGVMARLPELCCMRGGYVFSDGAAPGDGISTARSMGDLLAATGDIIYSQLGQAERTAVFVCTIGPGMERAARQLFLDGEAVAGHFTDAAASIAVETAASVLHDHIAAVALRQGFRVTNRFSPGYCGWPVSDQRKLFSLFPAGFCGVTLTESSLMLPIKSVSGIIGIGKRVTREPYSCGRCGKNRCTYRTYRVEHQRKEG
jgi:hypothetical protein